MKFNNTLAEYRVEQLEAAIDDFFNIEDIDDEIKMRFLKESAKYLGMFMPDNKVDMPNKKEIN